MSSMLGPLRQAVASSSRRVLAQRSAQRLLTLSAASLRANTAQTVRQSVLKGLVSSKAAFSVSARVLGEGSTDDAFAAKLAEELQYEKEADTAGEPDFIKEFKAGGVWTIHDTPGSDEVTLTRTFGNEEIRLMFSIADLESSPDYESMPEEGAEGEDGEASSGKSEEAEPNANGMSPIRCSFAITKSGTEGAINVDSLCEEGAFLLENISFYPDTKVGTELTAESDWKRRGMYVGPQFEQLDPAVQEEFERFLAERGINETLAVFIPDYAEYKEQREYVRWLGNLKSFIEA